MKKPTSFVTRCGALCCAAALLLAACGGDEYADGLADEHADDKPVPTAAVEPPRVPVTGQDIAYGNAGGRTLNGFTAVPAQPDSVRRTMRVPPDTMLPGLLVVHEWWGLNDNVRAMARRLAGEGYRVLAVDLYGGAVAETPEEARQLVGQALGDSAALAANMRAAYGFLAERHRAPRIGILGWCFGGTVTLQTALALSGALDAAVIYYGFVADVPSSAVSRLTMPVLGLFGREDQSIPMADVQAFERALQGLRNGSSVQVYDDAGHAFANPSGQNYTEAAAEDAWNKTAAFLNEHLYVPLRDTTSADSTNAR